MIKWPEIQYVEAEDGMLDPVLEFPKQPEGNIGKYGNMRMEYLVQHRKVIYSMMCLDGTLKQHLTGTGLGIGFLRRKQFSAQRS